jgi:phytoene synthase
MSIDKEIHQITLSSKSNFLYSFFLLPKEKRKAIYTLYAFCRLTDDIADNLDPADKRLSRLNKWEKELKICLTKSAKNYFFTLKQVAERFKIPFDHFFELIDGVRMDIANLRYNSFDDLKLYCYRVASTVGLMSIQIFGYKDPAILAYAENMGIALQLTNIIRDVGADAKLGRIYLPQEELNRFGVSEPEIMRNSYSENFYNLMNFQANRAHEYYKRADECLPSHEIRNMLVSEIMKNIYLKLLQKIEENHFRVLDNKIRLSLPRKIYITAKTFFDIKLA